MNRLVYIVLVLILIPLISFSQKREFRELAIYHQIENGDYISALDSIDILMQDYRNNNLILAKIQVLYKLKKYEDAIKLANTANKSSNAIASDLELKIFLDQDDFLKAEKVLIDNLKSRYKISLYDLLNNPDYNKLIGSELIDSILNTNIYSNTEKQLYQAEKLYNSEKFDQADFILDQIIKRNDRIAEAYYFKSLIADKKNYTNRALNLINLAINTKSSNPDFYIQRASLLIDLKKYKQAQFDIDKLMRIKPAGLENYILKSKLLLANREYEEAVKLTEQLFEIGSKNTDLLYVNSKANYMLGNNMQALKSVNELMTTQVSKEAFELRGDIYMNTKTYEFAIQDYSMFLDIEPYNATIYNKKGMARFNFGDREGACSDWQKAKRYGSYDAVKNLEKYCK